MQILRRTLVLLLCLCMVIPYVNIPHAHAAGGAKNITLDVKETTVDVGDIVTVVITNGETNAEGFGLYLSFDNTLLACEGITGVDGDEWMGLYIPGKRGDVFVDATYADDVANTNSDGIFSFAYMPGTEKTIYEGTVATLTFRALAAGTVNFVLNEDTAGTDAFKGVAGTQTLTIIGETEPPCCSDDCPHIINTLPYSQTCTADEDHFYSWTAPKDGKATFAHDGSADVIVYTDDNREYQTLDSSNNTITVDVTAGEKLTINAYGLGEGDWTWTATFEEEHVCTAGAVSYVKGTNGKHTKVIACADNCGKNYSETEETCSGGTADCEHAATCAYCGNTYGEAKGHGKTNGFRYVHNDGTDTHDVICADCQKTVEENVACTFEDGSHVCKFACGNKTDCADKTGDKDHKCDVCGKDNITQCAGGTATCLNPAVCSECGKEYGKVDAENHVGNRETKYTDKGENHTVTVTCECGAEISSKNEPHNYGEDFICDNCGHELAGWVEKDGNWYYVDDEGKAATGAARVPYPTVAINGKTYGPNAEDVAYAKNNASSKYTDAETAVFVFDEKGVFQSDFTGLVGGNRYAVNGVIAWHVGLVEINGEYYYFAGDVNGGGNIMATGKVYASRNTTGFEIVAGGIYYFGEDGKMCQYEGIVEIDGEKFYFEDNRLMIGAGLTELDGQYIYVRSNGQLATGKYWVAKTNGICSVGMYTFDENGFMQTAKDPTVNGLVDGIYYKDGMPYYAGLIEIDGDIYYINSAGEAVTGIYYITKVDNYTGEMEFNRGDKLNFGVDGKLILE